MLSKKNFLILAFVVLFFSLIFSLTANKTKKQPPAINPFPTPTKVPIIRMKKTPEGKLDISGVVVNDFTKTPKYTDKSGDVFFVDNQEYQILYMEKYNKFLISILSSPFKEVKQKAEIEFLGSLGVSKEDACRLSVEITTPYFANPKESGKIYTLSFCNQ